jgi:hypothetical protein
MRFTEYLAEMDEEDLPIIYDIVKRKLEAGDTIYLVLPKANGSYTLLTKLEVVIDKRWSDKQMLKLTTRAFIIHPDQAPLTFLNYEIEDLDKLDTMRLVKLSDRTWRLEA